MQETTKTIKPFGIGVQQVRLLDVFVVAPFLFYVGSQKTLSKEIRISLMGLGVATLLYNGINYLKNNQ